MATDAGLSRRKPGFDSPWGHSFLIQFSIKKNSLFWLQLSFESQTLEA
ncbi:uncharacterized protein METZ01_LOCUS155809 [marine metagenome]|uniref:Uncharacterized protein n=1 Tax=marine metagenome TaxID=408172 RepID=A0A382AN21_9ZZZZ